MCGILRDGTIEKFRFEFVDRVDANRKAQELRNIVSGVRYNVSRKSKYLDIIVEEIEREA